jgi:beta-1,2-mannobiose phosphorylase / 1,2-beta-oligomannan phosphorylase
MKIRRCIYNPVVTPGIENWRKVVTFNPGILYEDGTFYLYERAAGSLRPFRTFIGLHESKDGIKFRLVSEKPVFSSDMLGLPEGSVQDARVVKINGKYYMSFAMQPYGFDCLPTGEGVPDYPTDKYPGWKKMAYPMITQSGIAVSDDRLNFKLLCYTSPPEIDDRDHVLFPEKINGNFVLLRRPMEFTGEKYGTARPGIWLCYSDDLMTWSEPRLLAVSENSWEGNRIGAAASPVKTSEGWLLLYHGVDENSVYRVGAMLLDPEDPVKVIARASSFIMEPEMYYEKFGLIIPNVIFPTGNIIKDDMLYIYYGCCDSNISLATVRLKELLQFILNSN